MKTRLNTMIAQLPCIIANTRQTILEKTWNTRCFYLSNGMQTVLSSFLRFVAANGFDFSAPLLSR